MNERLFLTLALWFAAFFMVAATAAAPARNLGTGFFVSEAGHFVTASHVIGGCKTPAVLTPDGPMPADLVARSADEDVAVIKTRMVGRAYARFAADPTRAFRRALSVTRFRHEGGLGSESTTMARFLGKTAARHGRYAIKAKDAIVGGNSGSPLVDHRGGVVGMMVARAKTKPRVGIAVDAFTITEFLSQSNVTIETVGAGDARVAANGMSITGGYTFPVVCDKDKKKTADGPD